jgi:transcriptional regulator with XRE-family HTH domain
MALIGARLRELRQNRDLTLKQVADATGFAVSYLSLLERDKISISVDNLERLAQFYRVRMVHLFRGAEESPVLVTRRSQIEELLSGTEAGRSVFVLLADRADARMEPLLVRIGSGRGDPHFRTTDADTLLYVLEGQVRLISEKGDEVTLAPGDAAYYFGFPGHRIENGSQRELAMVLLVTTPPTSPRDDVIDAQQGVLIQTEDESKEIR